MLRCFLMLLFGQLIIPVKPLCWCWLGCIFNFLDKGREKMVEEAEQKWKRITDWLKDTPQIKQTMEAKWGFTGSENPITLGPSKHTPSLSTSPIRELGFGLQISNYHDLSYILFNPFYLTLFILYLTVCFESELPLPAKNLQSFCQYRTKKWKPFEQ